MKGKLFIMVAALMSAFTLSSCLGDDNSSSEYPDYDRMVTVGTGAAILYTDNGERLLPVNTVTGLDKVERAVVAFDLAKEELNGTKLESGNTYEVTLFPNYCYSVPTSSMIDLNNNAVAADSLINSQSPIASIDNLYIKNGYVTVSLTFSLNRFAKYYFDMGYDSEVDVDVANKTLGLTLYYDNKAGYGDYSMQYPFCFRIPTSLYYQYEEAGVDEINVVLRYMNGSGAETGTATCKAKLGDFLSPYLM